MLRISKMADYAVVILAVMGRGDKGKMSSTSLSAQSGLPEPTVSKILKILTKADIVSSSRGVTGGYSLTKPASEISMRCIIAAIDGPVSITACVEGQSSDCSLAEVCNVHGRWNGVNAAISSALEQVSLADMIQEHHKVASNLKDERHGCY